MVWLLVCTRLPPIRGHLAVQRPNRWAEFADVVRHRDHLSAFAFTFFLVLGTFTVAPFIGPYLMATNGWKEGQLAQIYFAAGLCTFVGMGVIGRLADRLPRLALFRVFGCAALIMAVVVTNLPPGPLWVAMIALSGFMVFAAGRMVPVQAIVLGVPLPRNRGAFMSLNTSVQHAATGLAPLIAGSLVTVSDGRITGYPLVGWVAAATAALSLALAGLLRPARVEAPAVKVQEEPPTAEEPSEARTKVGAA